MWVWFRVWMSALRLCLPVKTSGMLFAFSFASDGELLAADQDDCSAPLDCSERLKSLDKNPKWRTDEYVNLSCRRCAGRWARNGQHKEGEAREGKIDSEQQS